MSNGGPRTKRRRAVADWRLVALVAVFAGATGAAELAPAVPDDAARYAWQAMQRAVVVAGNFVDVCDSIEPSSLNARLVALEFGIDEQLKGDVGRSVLPVLASSDLLACPPGSATRYEQRQLLREQLQGEMAKIDRRLRSLGTPRRPSTEERELRRKHSQLGERFNALDTTVLSRGKGAKLVWELGGAIRPDTRYLLALSPDDEGLYTISVLFDGSMWWGEQAERIAAAIREAARE